MMWHSLLRERKSQIFICVLIIFAIIMGLGAALLFHSRSAREISRLQSKAGRAYSLAKSGLDIGKKLGASGLPKTYDNIFGEGTKLTLTLEGTTKLISTGTVGGSTRVLTKDIGGASQPTTWAKAYGGIGDDRGWFVAQTDEGSGIFGYILGGTVSKTTKAGFGAGGTDIMLIKTNDQGVKTWANAYGGSGDEQFYHNSIAIAPQNGGYICASSSTSFSASGSGEDILLVKVNITGDMEWARGFVGGKTDAPRAVIETQDKGYLVIGVTATSFPTAEGKAIKGEAIFAIKTDNQGRIGSEAVGTTWVRLYDNQLSISDEVPWGLAEDANKYIITGRRQHIDLDGVVLAIDKSNGEIGANQRHFGMPKSGTENLYGVLPITGGYVITGDTNAFGPDGSAANCFFIKLDSNLDPVGTSKVFDESLSNQKGVDIKPAASGYALAVGGNNDDYLLIQTDLDGNLKSGSSRLYGESGVEGLRSLDNTTDGFVLGGYTDGYGVSGSSYNWLIVKTDFSGQLACNPNISRSSASLTQTDFNLVATPDYPLTALTVNKADKTVIGLEDVNVGPTSQGGSNKILQNSASSVDVTDVCK